MKRICLLLVLIFNCSILAAQSYEEVRHLIISDLGGASSFIAEMDDVLSEEMKTAAAVGTKVGGVESVAEILNSLDKATETRILAKDFPS